MTGQSGATADVVVHVHPALPLWPSALLTHLVPLWRSTGLTVTVVDGPGQRHGARLGVLHVDLTRVPPAYAGLETVYRTLLNGSVLDIGKRRLDNGLAVRLEDPEPGPVIVKTDLNVGGLPERMVERRGTLWPRRLAATVLDHLRPGRPTGRRWWRHAYPVYPSMAAVPRWVWSRPDLVVQRFVPERVSDRYLLRIWYFFGAVDYHLVRYASDPTFSARSLTGADELGDVPPELRRLRLAWGFDFGKFDYVLCEGRPVVLDANKTPSFGLDATPFHRPALPRLARGIQAWL